ncbi:ABC transporter ATP-binding protein [Nonomuraea sp. KC401]|uniref:ATP-binding cassette domain-containing protein n=1 Tax=unclassified Nonomuraea TaxID=2593643 RepID=UPI0010FDCA1B|nr:MULTISPECIES: ATP-binding cassette domain-containing protein [unclassified Nonomuraea]NBE95453.1 ATP-binding cassette domain-containing protein [Nonomuraea sp. K271]TLF83421.1 ABC transporter ATP-binding protein [Nonomuraea sp. KC401]
MTLLRAKDLTKRFVSRGPLGAKTAFTAVDRVSFDVRLGETLAVVGESGSGKSTTARMIAKLLEPSEGTLEFEGEDVTRAKGPALARFRGNVQVVFQDPFSSLNPRHTVERILMAPLVYQGIAPHGSRRAHAKELMERVGLDPDHSLRYPAQFSGGQAQRIGIARALAVNPKLVICDEAVSALDVSVQAQVIELLRRLQRESGFSYVFIAHDLAVVRQIAQRVAVMSKGRIVELGTTAQVFGDPQDEYTRTLLAAIPRIDPEWERRRRERA